MCTTLCEHLQWVHICSWRFFLKKCGHVAGQFTQTHVVEYKEIYQLQQNLLYYRNWKAVNHPASPSSAHSSGPSAALFSLWNCETHKYKDFYCLSPSLLLLKIWTSLSSSALSILLPPHSVYDKILCCLWFFFPLSHLLLVICQCFVCHVFISARAHQNHFTTICPPFTVYWMLNFVV